MPEQKLWLINNDGKIFTLSVQSRHVQHVTNFDQETGEFKRLSAAGQCTWALGSDHQLYVFIPSSDIPIRVQEATYENERWTPGVGWTGKTIFPNARQNWSDINGTGFSPKESFELPSSNWEWEGDWQVDENMAGEISGLAGWQYATNWIGKFSAERSWRSYVRRRRWVRYRRYLNADRWAQIPQLYDDKDGLTVQFLDVSLGGEDVSSQLDGHLYVWAVSITEKVYIREGVSFTCPEGFSWRQICVNDENDSDIAIVDVSVGSHGQVWVVSADGNTFVRTNVSVDNPYGTDWVKVVPPEGYNFLRISVGRSSVWALTRGGKIWFRKLKSGCDVIEGSWIEMVGELSFISVGNDDQVIGLSKNDNSVLIRTGITHDSLTGKTWQPLTILEPRPAEFTSSIDSKTSGSSSAQSSIRGLHRVTPTNRNINFGLNQYSQSLSSSRPDSGTSFSTQSISATSSSTSLITSDRIVQRGTLNSSIKIQNLEKTNPSDLDEKDAYVEIELVASCDTNEADVNIGLPNSNKAQEAVLFEPLCDNADNDTSTSDQLSDSIVNPAINSVIQCDISSSTCDISKDGAENVKFDQNGSFCVDFATDLLSSEEKEEIFSTQVDETYNFVTDLLIDTDNNGYHDTVQEIHTNSQNTEVKKNDDACEEPKVLNHSDIPDNPERNNSSSNNQTFLKNSESLNAIDKLNFQRNPAFRDSPFEESSVSDFERSSSAVEVNLNWIWVSNKACYLEDTSQLPWIHKNTETRPAIDADLRQTLLDQIWKRNSLALRYSHYEDAIEKTVWMKHGQLQLKLSLKRTSVWIACQLDLEQGLQEKSTQDGFLYVNYSYDDKATNEQVSLVDIVCVCRLATHNQKPVFGIFQASDIEAKKKPYILSAESEKDTNDWVASIAMACKTVRGQGHMIDPISMWAVTELGDVFVHQHSHQVNNISQMLWEQVGGHMLMVKSNSLGITWAISHDKNVFVYSGGHGGGIFKGIPGSSTGTLPQTDVRTLSIYENQKWHFLTGYSARYLLANKYAWTDETGKIPLIKEFIKPPTASWQWLGDWMIERNVAGGVDSDGWQYTSSFPRNCDFHAESKWKDNYRRRKWIRKCRLITSGPWIPVGPLSIVDVSVQLVTNTDKMAAVWAVGANGDALCRTGVSSDIPQGDGWIHVPADQPFLAISIGGNHWLWAIARDGSTWFRSGITPETPTGKAWLQIVPPPPAGDPLQQISVGENSVWAIDADNKLWRRKETSVIFPEGIEWELVCKDIRRVSVGPNDQVFAVRDNVVHKKSTLNGVISKRIGISEERPLGTDWEDGIGGVWSQISCSAFPVDVN